MIFKEERKIKQPCIWILLILACLTSIGLFGYGFYIQIVQKEKFVNYPMSDNELITVFILTLIFFILIFLLIGSAKLTTIINKNGIVLRFFPLHFKTRKITWIL